MISFQYHFSMASCQSSFAEGVFHEWEMQNHSARTSLLEPHGDTNSISSESEIDNHHIPLDLTANVSAFSSSSSITERPPSVGHADSLTHSRTNSSVHSTNEAIPGPATVPPVKPPQRIKRWKKTLHDGWAFEFLSFLIAVGSLVAIIAILSHFNNIEQPQWKYSINLSTLIAFLATILRSMLAVIIDSGWCSPLQFQ